MTDTQVQDAPQVEAPVPTEVAAPEAPTTDDLTSKQPTEPPADAVPPAPAPVAPAPRTGNAAWPAEDERRRVAAQMAKLRAAGYTRPELSALTGFNDSTVWRAQNSKVHFHEVSVWDELVFTPFADGEGPLLKEHPPAASLRTPKPEVLQAKLAEVEAKLEAVHARITGAVEALTNPDVKTVKDLRALVTEVAASLSA